MIGFKHTKTFMDILRLLMFFALYFGPVDSQEDYYRSNPSSVPIFQKVPDNITVQEGELAKLICRIKNLGPKVVVWRRTDQESPLTVGETTFNPDGRIEIEYERLSEVETRWDLIIKDVRDSDAGIYACQVSSTKIYTNNVTLNVIDPIEYKPDIIITGSQYVSLREDIELTCNATGAMKPFEQVDWFFKGEPIDESKPFWHGRLTELKHIPFPGRSLISKILIEKATMEDSGNYLCRATAKLTKGRKVHVLNDTVKPKEPRDSEDNENKLGAYTSGSSVCEKQYVNKYSILIVITSLNILIYMAR